MTIQDNAFQGGRQTAPPKGKPRAFPVPSDHSALRRIEARRRAALRAAHPEQARVYVGPWGAAPSEPARRPESRIASTLRRVDTIAMGLMSASVLALWPFAVSLLMGWI